MTPLPAGISFSQTRAGDIVQDASGFIWVGTQFGLNRYDGFRVKQFFHDPKVPSSVGCFYIRHLFKDRGGRLWISCDGSLDRYDPDIESFHHFQLLDHGTRSTPVVSSISEDRDGTLWLATLGGGIHFNPQTGSSLLLPLRDAVSGEPDTEAISWIEEDRAHHLWALTPNALVQFDRTTGVAERRVSLGRSVSSGSFHQDRWGNLWLIASFRLYRVDLDSGLVREIRKIPGLNLESPGPVNAMMEDENGDMWFGTDMGVIHLPHGSGAAERYSPRVGSSNSLPSDRVTMLAQDSSGDIWVGFHDVAPIVIQRNSTTAETLSFQPGRSNGLRSSLVTAIGELTAGKLLIATSGATQVLDERTGRYSEPFHYLVKRDVFDIYRDHEGRTWLASDQGIYRLRPGAQVAERLLQGEDVHRFLEDPGGGLWVLLRDKLMHFSNASNDFTTLATAAGGEDFQAVSQSPDGTLWIGSSSGIRRIDPRTGVAHSYPYLNGSEAGPGDSRINSLRFDTHGRLWVGTQSGLNLFDPQAQRFLRFAQPNELGGQIISCILEDRSGKLWMGSNQGLLRFDPDARKFALYNSAFGVSSLDLSGWGACAKSGKSRYLFGGFAGVASFIPEDITKNPVIPHVLLTDLLIEDRVISIGPRSPLKRSITQTARLDLAYSQDDFSLEFSALEFRSPATARFRYRLDGLDENWVMVPAGQHSLSFAHLAGKTYTLHLQAVSSEGNPQDPGITLVVVIAKPWWATWWMYTLYISFTLLIARLAYRARIRRLSAIFNARTEGRVRERTALARELHDTLLQDFQGLILRLASVTAQMPEDDRLRPQLDSAMDRAQLSLISGRDSIQQMRTAPMRLVELPGAFRELARDVQLSRTELQVQTVATFESETDYDVHEIFQIGREAIRNALQHANASRVEVVLTCNENGFRLAVTDDGIGLPPKVLNGGEVPGHWGIHGMRERAQRLRGTLTYLQPLHGGTVLDLEIPSRRASNRSFKERLARFLRPSLTAPPAE
ncbi:sensor histidine kinase [Terriglobus roseus]|nr:two-component regulator propeller domain-containing protein [Terriglobus roseus]